LVMIQIRGSAVRMMLWLGAAVLVGPDYALQRA